MAPCPLHIIILCASVATWRVFTCLFIRRREQYNSKTNAQIIDKFCRGTNMVVIYGQSKTKLLSNSRKKTPFLNLNGKHQEVKERWEERKDD